MSSDNLTGADNQQETESPLLELDPMWVVGFTDGEGCFCVSVHQNRRFASRSFGWQLHPVFQVSQHRRHRAVLEELRSFFGCGKVRDKGKHSSVLVYAVDTLRDLSDRVIPFFEIHPLLVKQRDFETFAGIVAGIRSGAHFTETGFECLVRAAYSMNVDGKQRKRPVEEVLGILRDCTPGARLDRVKVQSELHGDMQSQAEMTWPTPQPRCE